MTAASLGVFPSGVKVSEEGVLDSTGRSEGPTVNTCQEEGSSLQDRQEVARVILQLSLEVALFLRSFFKNSYFVTKQQSQMNVEIVI